MTADITSSGSRSTDLESSTREIETALKWIKGKSAERLFRKFPKLKKQYWGQHLWARGYFVSTVGIADAVITQYIQRQRNQEVQDFNTLWKSK